MYHMLFLFICLVSFLCFPSLSASLGVGSMARDSGSLLVHLLVADHERKKGQEKKATTGRSCISQTNDNLIGATYCQVQNSNF